MRIPTLTILPVQRFIQERLLVNSDPRVTKQRSAIIWAGISLAEWMAFVANELWRVYLWGIHAADDGYFAVIAKNLATGWGYSSTVGGQYKFAVTPFDVYATTGPTLIVPAALFIRLFGNKYWVPGLATVFCWSITLLLIGMLAHKYNSGPGFALATLAFLFVSFATPWYSGTWSVLLGEIPAALLIILGVFLFFHSEFPRFKILAGVAFGLSILTKALAVGGIGGFFFALGIMHLIGHWRDRSLTPWIAFLRTCALVGLGIILPIAVFEAWKFLVLGPSGYIANIAQFWQVFFGWGVKAEQPMGFGDLLYSRMGSLWSDFAISLPGAILMLVLALFVLRNDQRLRQIFFAFASMFVFYSIWWTFFSIGWPRYYIIAIAVLFIVIALPFLQPRLPLRVCLPYAFIIALLSIPFWSNVSYRIHELGSRDRAGREHTAALLAASHILEQAAKKDKVIVTQYWATAADLEYTMSSHLNFTHYADTTAIGRKPFLIAINTTWWLKEDTYFGAMLENCKQRQMIGSYLIASCPAIRKK